MVYSHNHSPLTSPTLNAQRVRKVLYRFTVQDKKVGLGQETVFDFKYVPQLGLTTSPGEQEDLNNISPGLKIPLGLAVKTLVMGAFAWVTIRSVVRWAELW